MAGVDEPQRDPAEQQQRQQLEHGGDDLHAAGFAHAGEVDRAAQPQRAERAGGRAHRRGRQRRETAPMLPANATAIAAFAHHTDTQ